MELIKPKVELVHATPEDLIAYTSRACYQSFDKQDEASDDRLIKHFVGNNESPLEFAWACMDITCSYATHVHLLRHRFFSFQWRSQRYDETMKFVMPVEDELSITVGDGYKYAIENFENLRSLGAKKQEARYVVPQGVAVQGFMAGNARAWLSFLGLRTSKKVMPETQEVANLVKEELRTVWPRLIS